jgi:hypothetical protein
LQGFEALACFCLVRELHPHSLSKHFKENIWESLHQHFCPASLETCFLILITLALCRLGFNCLSFQLLNHHLILYCFKHFPFNVALGL